MRKTGRIGLLLLLACVTTLTGCSRTEEKTEQTGKETPVTAGTYGSLTIAAAEMSAVKVSKDAYGVRHVDEPMTIDGALDDWDAVQALEIGSDRDAVHGRAWVAWEDKHFLLACEITDPSFRNTGTGGNASLEHCLAFDFDGWHGTGRSSAERMTFALTPRGVETSWDILHRDDPGACVIRKTGADTYVYEIALGWHDMQPIAPGIGATFGFDVVYQYLDEDGRRRCVRWQKAAGRNPARRRHGDAFLAPSRKTAGNHLYIAPKSYDVGEDDTLALPTLIACEGTIKGATLSARIAEGGPGGDVKTSQQTKLDLEKGQHAFDVTWHAKDVPAGTYHFVVTLSDASGKVIASDFFRAHKTPALRIKAKYEELKPLYERLKSAGSAIYAKDADSVDIRMETLASFARRKLNGTQAAQLERIAANTREVLDAMLAGKDYFADARGWVVYGFRSPYDDTLQPYEVFVPKEYDASKPWPLIVHLHGAGGNDPLKLLDGTYTARYFPKPDFRHLQMMPFARGRSGYRGLGLTEVLDTIDYTKSRYHVEADRVSIKGFSMGGAGTWKIALWYPDRFAAANPRAGFVGYQLYDELKGGRTARTWKQAVRMTSSPIFFCENANNLHLSLYHGGSDPTIPVQNTYRMWQRLTELGGDYSLFVYHARQHTWAKNLDPIQNADMLACRRNPYPARVVYRTNHLHFHRAYWVSVERLSNPLTLAEIDALAQAGIITVKADDVDAFAFDLATELIRGDAVKVVVNGKTVFDGKVPPDRKLFVERTGDDAWRVGKRPARGDRVKQPGLSGPIDDAFYGRVLYVYGTQAKDPELNAALKNLATKRCGLHEPNKAVSRKRHGFYPVKADVDVTDEDVHRAHLVLIGCPETNAITAKVAGALPVSWGREYFTIAGKTYAGSSHGVKFICPNPLAPGRYVIVTAANSIEGYQATTDLRRNVPDWAVTEGAYHRSGENIIEAGYFNNRWK